MRPGQQAATGKGGYLAAEARLEQAEHQIHHGEAGADHRHLGVLRQVRERRLVPRVRKHNAIRTAGPGEIADGDDDAIGVKAGAARCFQPEAGAGALDINDFLGVVLNHRAAGGGGRLITEIVPVEPPGREGADVTAMDLVRGGRAAMGQPVVEMAGIVGIGAHVRRPDVEQIGNPAALIGQPPAGFTAALEQKDPIFRTQPAAQLDRDHRTGKSPADDADHPAFPCPLREIAATRHLYFLTDPPGIQP